MTFARAVIIAFLVSAFVEHAEWDARAIAIAIAWACWAFTNDLLPAAVLNGLRAYAKEYRGG